MQMQAYSVVPPSPVPYLHLGYISAAPPNIPAVYIFQFLFLAFVCLSVASAAGKQRPVLRTVFFVFMAISLAAVPFAWQHGEKQLARLRITMTEERVHRYYMPALDNAIARSQTHLQSLVAWQQDHCLDPKDGWGCRYRLVASGDRKDPSFNVFSNGPDRMPNTADDLAWPYRPSMNR